MKVRIVKILMVAVLVLSITPGMAVSVVQADDGNDFSAWDQLFRSVHVGADVDQVEADTEFSGNYSWHLFLGNGSNQTVNDPTITVNSNLNPGFFPNVGEFPATWSLENLEPDEKWILYDLHSSYPATFTLGYDFSRTMEPLEIPSGGGVQTVTIKITPVDSRYTSGQGMQIWVNGNVIADSNTQPEEAKTTINPEGRQSINWLFTGWELGEYTFSVQLQVANSLGVSFVNKPEVGVYVESSQLLDSAPGTSTIINDEILDGDITYSIPVEGNWRRSILNCWQVIYGEIVEPVNSVSWEYFTWQMYKSSGDSFSNSESPVTGRTRWSTNMDNYRDETGAPITGLELSLDSELSLNWSRAGLPNVYPVSTTPPNYQWSFDDVPDGDTGGIFVTPVEPVNVTFSPGFDASRSVDRTMFSQAGGTQALTLTITVTPQEVPSMPMFIIWVAADSNPVGIPVDGDDRVDAVITSAPGQIHSNGSFADIRIPVEQVGEPTTFDVMIDVMPKVANVEYVPAIWVLTIGDVLGTGPNEGNNQHSYTLDALGTWTWSADGNYKGGWGEGIFKAVTFRGRAVTSVPPIISSLTANPDELWPPNHKSRDVTLNVNAYDQDGDIVRTTYSVADEYGEYDVAETDLPEDGIISLISERDGKDKDGRIYTITVTVYDTEGLSDNYSVDVLVPHDQGKDKD